jgi:hypothetical protein
MGSLYSLAKQYTPHIATEPDSGKPYKKLDFHSAGSAARE